MLKRILLTITVLALAATAAHAHLRDYLVTYGYWTVPRGMFEIEFYNDFNTTDDGETVYVNQTELEYGVTSRLMLGVYAVSEKKGSHPLEYAKTKFQVRYRFGESRRLPVDPALYFEYKLGAGGRADEVEAKLLLSRDFGTNLAWNAAANLIAEKSREAGSRWEYGCALGICKRINERITAGLEFKTMEEKSYVIPGAYITLGAGRRLNIGLSFGTSGNADSFQLKTIMEFELF